MYKNTFSLNRIGLVVAGLLFCFNSFADNLTEKLETLSDIRKISTLESNDKLDKRVCFIEQQTDWKQHAAGTFEQRIIIKHRGFDKPTVMVTEGYDANYALRPSYKEELSSLIDANLIFVEHRYFDASTPSPCNWDYLTVENSAADYHHIRKVLGKIYPGKWFTTGISKGGQTTLFYRSMYPEDVDGSVAYVAPLNKSLEDGRHEPFLNAMADSKKGQAIQAFQREVLKRRSTIQPIFEDYCRKKKYEFRTSMDGIFELTVLEFEFSFWQWGEKQGNIPDSNASDSALCRYLTQISDPGYFSPKSGNTPFNVQAMKELGYYGYDMERFGDLLKMKHTEGYMRRVMIPDSLTYIEFDSNLYESVNHFLHTSDCPMMFIYGENDPWTATGVTWLKNKKKMHVFIEPGGSHRARIKTMPRDIQKRIRRILNSWLK